MLLFDLASKTETFLEAQNRREGLRRRERLLARPRIRSSGPGKDELSKPGL